MAENARNVLRVNAVEEQERYRRAVASIIVDIQRDTGKTLVEIAEEIDVSVGTISNAANRKADLSSVYLNRLGSRYGVQRLTPVAKLAGGRVVAINANDEDPLPRLLAACLKIGEARDPASDGGENETHRELLAMLPDLVKASRAISGMIARAEAFAA